MVSIESKKCVLCGYEWIPRGLGTPGTCPKCRKKDWNKEIQKKTGDQQNG